MECVRDKLWNYFWKILNSIVEIFGFEPENRKGFLTTRISAIMVLNQDMLKELVLVMTYHIGQQSSVMISKV